MDVLFLSEQLVKRALFEVDVNGTHLSQRHLHATFSSFSANFFLAQDILSVPCPQKFFCVIDFRAMFTTLPDTQETHTTATGRLHLQSMKGEREEEIKKKKARRSEGQRLTEKEDERKKQTHKCVRKRSRSKGRCELSEEQEEKEVKIRRKLKAESADPESISDTD